LNQSRLGSTVRGRVSEQAEFPNWKLTPARLNATQAAWFLGFEPDEITMLVGAGLLKPLGHPAGNSAKLFATEILQQLWPDENRLGKATDAITNYWKQRNARKKTVRGSRPNGNGNTGESPCSIRLARRDQRSLIPHHAHAPAPSPPGGGRFAALRSRSSRTATWERHLRHASV